MVIFVFLMFVCIVVGAAAVAPEKPYSESDRLREKQEIRDRVRKPGRSK